MSITAEVPAAIEIRRWEKFYEETLKPQLAENAERIAQLEQTIRDKDTAIALLEGTIAEMQNVKTSKDPYCRADAWANASEVR